MLKIHPSSRLLQSCKAKFNITTPIASAPKETSVNAGNGIHELRRGIFRLNKSKI